MSVRQSSLSFEVERDERPHGLTSYAGLPLLSETALALSMPQSVERHLGGPVNAQGYSPWENLDAAMSAIAVGAKSFDDIAFLGRDQGYLRLTEKTRFPSATTLWRFACGAHELKTWKGGVEGKAVVPPESTMLQGLGRVNQDLVQAVQDRLQLKAGTVDLDATIVESHKQEALAHYDKGRGYQPYITLWAEANLILVDEFRDGNVPASTSALSQVKKAIWALPTGIDRKRFRADSALYDHQAMRWLDRNDVIFGISADMTPELRKTVEALGESDWRRLMKSDQLGTFPTDCDIAEVVYVTNQQSHAKGSRPFRYLVIRKREEQGRLFSDGQQRLYLAMVTNDWKSTAEHVWWWHKEKCGTVELAHDVMKNDLAAGVMPCGRFQANAAWFRINVLTYNLISAFKQLALDRSMEKWRPTTLRYRLLNLAGRLVEHARKLVLKLPWLDDLVDAYREYRHRLWAGVPFGATSAPAG